MSYAYVIVIILHPTHVPCDVSCVHSMTYRYIILLHFRPLDVLTFTYHLSPCCHAFIIFSLCSVTPYTYSKVLIRFVPTSNPYCPIIGPHCFVAAISYFDYNRLHTSGVILSDNSRWLHGRVTSSTDHWWFALSPEFLAYAPADDRIQLLDCDIW
jgi:hypothetical protein